MKTKFKIALLTFVLTSLSLSSCSPLCNDEIFDEKVSQNGEEAVLYIRNCGTTADFATHIKIIDEGKEEIIFVAEGAYEDSVKVEWVDKNNLEISYKDIDSTDIFEEKSAFGNIKITYIEI